MFVCLAAVFPAVAAFAADDSAPGEPVQSVQAGAQEKAENIEAIRTALTRSVSACEVTDSTLLTNARHYDLMMKIAADIDRIEEGLTGGLPTDLVAIDVRSALDKLGRLTGTITDNDVLNTVFGRFCIGK